MSNAVYKRGQVEWALWRVLKGVRNPQPPDPPPAFKVKIKKLLELDRAGDPAQPDEADGIGFAFHDQEAEGQGNEIAYTAMNTFALALGLEMLEAGFKQSEVVFVLRQTRPSLDRWFKTVHARPIAPDRQLVRFDSSRHRGLPSYEHREVDVVDWRIFMVIRSIDASSLTHRLGPRPSARPLGRLFLEPDYLEGTEALKAWLIGRGLGFRAALVLELARPAWFAQRFLDAAPETKRGRPGSAVRGRRVSVRERIN